MLGPATTAAPPNETPERKEKAPDNRAEQDEHGADRIVHDRRQARRRRRGLRRRGPGNTARHAAVQRRAAPNQEALVQVTPRFPGVVRAIRKRIGDQVAKDDLLATIESNQSLTVYELKAPIGGTVIDRQVTLGEYASEQKPAFIVADLSTIWVDLVGLPPRSQARAGSATTVLIDPEDGGDADRGQDFLRRRRSAPATRRARSRAPCCRTGRPAAARPVRHRPRRAARPSRVPTSRSSSSALQTLENKTVVFVREGDKFEAARGRARRDATPSTSRSCSALPPATSTPPRTASSSRPRSARDAAHEH